METVKGDNPSRYRTPPKVLRGATLMLPVIAIILTIIYVFHLRPFGWWMLEIGYLYLLIGLLLPIVFISIPMRKAGAKNRFPWYDVLLVCLSFGIPIYFYSKSYDIITEWGLTAPPSAIVLAFIMWAVVLEAARRAAGLAFTVVALLFSIYPLFSHIMPGPLWAPLLVNIPELATYHVLGVDSLLGVAMQIFGKIVIGFLLFAVAIEAAGAGKFFGIIASALLGNTRGGHAKVAIIASGFLGSVSGSSVANVYTTGSFTIPAMKRSGFPPHLAGAIEACASVGGQLMPPVMGAVAFIMAEFIEMSYAAVCLAAAVPSILYYMVLFVQIDLYAARVKLSPTKDTVGLMISRSRIWLVLFDNLHILLSIAILIYVLFFLDLEAYSPWLATLVLFALAMARKKTRLSGRQFLNFFEHSGKTIGELIAVLAPIGFIIGSFTVTGIAYSLPYEIIKIAHGQLYLLLLIGAIASFILGMGVSVAPCYIFMAIILCPGLVKGGVDLVAAHLFVLYCGLWSFITPPVAITAFAAANLAGADPMRTGFTAMRLGMAKYILPFFFVLSPVMIFRGGTLWETLYATVTCAVGLIFMSMAFEKYIWRLGEINILSAIIIFIAGFLIALPELYSTIAGMGIAVILIAGLINRRWVNSRKQ